MELYVYDTKRIRKNKDYLQERKWLSKYPGSFHYWTDVRGGGAGKVGHKVDFEGKVGFSRVKKVDIYWAYYNIVRHGMNLQSII